MYTIVVSKSEPNLLPQKKYPGRPFKCIAAQPVDMFPLTNHCEMVMTLERMSEEEYSKYHGADTTI